MGVDIDNTTTYVVGIATILGAIEKIFKPVRKARTSMIEFLRKRAENSVPNQIKALTTNVETLRDEVTKILYQVRHNGGESMRDDISAIKKEVQTLSVSHSVALEMMDDGWFRCTNDGRNYVVNRAYANMLGVTKEQILDREWIQWIPDEEYHERWKRAMELESSFSAQTYMIKPSGERINVRIKVVKFFDDYEGRIVQID